MSKSRRKRKSPKRVLALPDLVQAKSAVLNTLTSKRGGQLTYDCAITEFVEWFGSEPHLAFNRIVLKHAHRVENTIPSNTTDTRAENIAAPQPRGLHAPSRQM